MRHKQKEENRMLVIDRFENNIAVCEAEDKTVHNIPKYQLPLEAKEGDFLEKDSKGVYVVSAGKKDAKEQEIQKRFSRLFSR